MTTDTIALLATGSELINGDIANSDGQILAQKLSDANLIMGNQLVVSDDEADIERGMDFLLQHHKVLITTGGLGPTSDDRTRNVLANYLKSTLEFHQASWDNIIKRLTELNFTVSENNRQQAYFPKGASIFPNQHGTAAGCKVQHQDKLIYMLPGPPHECFPMFEEFVLPDLKQHLKPLDQIKLKWRVFGVPEAYMAAMFEDIVKAYPCEVGYRWHYPYIDLKVQTAAGDHVAALQTAVEQLIEPYVICPPDQKASTYLIQQLEQLSHPIVIIDNATGGLLEATLSTPKVRQQVCFVPQSGAGLTIIIDGLTEYWQLQKTDKLSLKFTVTTSQQTEVIEKPLRFFRSRTPDYAVELAAFVLYKIIFS